MTMNLYVDTSALSKWYIAESNSDAFDDFIRNHAGAAISRLTIVELRCMLARRRRNREISAKVEDAALRLFEADIRDGYLLVHAMSDAHFASASEILQQIPQIPLRTLDALHLAVAGSNGVDMIATADRVMGAAAKALKFETHLFH